MWAKAVKSPKTGTFFGSKSKLELLVCFGAAKTQVWQRTEKVGPEKNIGFLVGPARMITERSGGFNRGIRF
jgi:hypothetical protein